MRLASLGALDMPDTLIKIATWSTLPDRRPSAAVVSEVDLVVVRDGEKVSVFEGRCVHRAALLALGSVEGEDLICQEHGWDFRIDSGKSACIVGEALHKFDAHVDEARDAVVVDEGEVEAWKVANPSAFRRGELDES